MSGSGLPFRQFVLKVCSRCDLACDHCYVYEHADQSWRGRPKVMSDETIIRTAERIAEHVQDHALPQVRVILHGGEPLLAGAARLSWVCETLRREVGKACRLDLRIHTNGVQLDDEFCRLFADYQVKVGISIDGDRIANDRHRRYANGRSSYDQVVRAIGRLRDERYRTLYSGLLCTIDVRNDPIITYNALAAFEPPLIDFLFPHGTWDCPPPNAAGSATPYADWLIAIFDQWITATDRVPVRLFESIMRTTYGGSSLTESLGLSASDVAVIETDGSIEQADSLKVAFDGAPGTGLDIFRNTLAEASLHPGITARQQGPAGLCLTCRSCPVVTSCGGGLYAHRYRKGTDFNNPSVYCADLMKLISHVRGRLKPVSARPAGMRPAHVIPDRHLDALAAGYGDHIAIGYLQESQRSLRRALLGLVRQRMGERALPAPDSAVFNAGWELITALDADNRDVLDGVLAHPYVRAWATHYIGQLDASAGGAGSLGLDAAHLAAIAASAAIWAGWQAQLDIPVRHGHVFLPTLGCLAVGPGATATIVTGGDGFELKTDSGQWSVMIAATAGPGQPGCWHPVRVLEADGAEAALEDTDPYRDCHQWTAASRLSAEQAESWQCLYRQAWALIRREHSAYSLGLAAGLSTIMPLVNDKPGREISAAARQAFGAVGVALPADASTLALLIMHEFQHVKLGAVLDLFELYDASDQRLFYAPWRNDPRPLEALLQGTYAHIAVTDFWRLRRHYLPGPEAEAAAAKFALWRMQTAEAIETLETSGSLTTLGERFVGGMRATVMPWLEESIPECAGSAARQWAADHRRAWHGRLARHQLMGQRPFPAPDADSMARSSGRPGGQVLPARRSVTCADMARDLRELGLAPGRTLLVSASLASIGWVEGGAGSVVAALREALGPSGSLVVPTGTADNSDTSREHLARIAGMDEAEIEKFRAEMRPFDRSATPSTGMGRISEAVRANPEAIRSHHPQTSFAALGPMAAWLMGEHALTCHLGGDSPLGKMYLMDRDELVYDPAEAFPVRKIYQAGAWVLLLGVDFTACTAFHLAEYLYTAHPPLRKYRCVIDDGSGGQWAEYEDVVLDDSEFEIIGKEFDSSEIPLVGKVGDADCRLMPLCETVNFAAGWLRANRCDHSD